MIVVIFGINTTSNISKLLYVASEIWDNFKDMILTIITSFSFRWVPAKEKEFAYITGFSSNVYKTISAAEARISTTSTPRSYISAMLLALKSLLFFCLDIFEP